MKSTVNAIILAAGMSSRMGKTKQILHIDDKTILEHAIHRALTVNFSKVLTVIGHNAPKIKETIFIGDRRFQWVVNKDYHLGLSTSLKLGIESLRQEHSNIMIFLGDLPFISTETINHIYQLGLKMGHETEEAFVVQPHYQEKPGHPVFLGNVDRNLIRLLQGDKGLKPIMNQIHVHKCIEVRDQGILMDIDKPEDYEQAKSYIRL